VGHGTNCGFLIPGDLPFNCTTQAGGGSKYIFVLGKLVLHLELFGIPHSCGDGRIFNVADDICQILPGEFN